jgi:predicted nucleotidyltransferase
VIKKKSKLKNPRDEEFLKQLIIKKKKFGRNIMYEALIYDDIDTDDLIHVGYAEFNPDKIWIDNVEVDKPFKRKGVATFLYNYIEKDQNVKLKPSDSLFPEGKAFWKNRLRRKNPTSELEQFRLNSIKEIKKDANYLGDVITENINSSRFEIYIVGSILNKNKFNKNSDVDLAIVIYDKRLANGWNEKLTDELRDIFKKIPFNFGFLDVSVHNNELLPKQEKLKIYEHE